MRRALALSLVCLLAACDSVGPTDRKALVGSWRVTSFDTDVVVTSTIDQSVPDLGGPGTGGILATGAETAALRYVVGVTVDAETRAISFADRTLSDLFGSEFAALSLVQSPFGSDVSLEVATATTSASYGAPAPNGPAFTYADGLFTVPRLTLDDGAGNQAVVQGTLRFPEVPLAAGVPSRLPTQDEPEAFDGTFTFSEDGTFTAEILDSGNRDTERGTWTADDDGQVTIRVTESGRTNRTKFDFEVRDGQLTLTADLDDECDAECRDSFAANTLAIPGSYAALDIVERYTLVRAGATANLRTAPAARRPWAPRTWRSLTR